MEEKCTACGTCAEYCPIFIRDEYNLGLDETKCIYVSTGPDEEKIQTQIEIELSRTV